MKKYKNLKTGAIIDSSFAISGDDWELFDASNLAPSKESPNENENDEEEVDLNEMKKDELIEFAKEHQIEIDSTQKKSVIIEVIAAAFE